MYEYLSSIAGRIVLMHQFNNKMRSVIHVNTRRISSQASCMHFIRVPHSVFCESIKIFIENSLLNLFNPLGNDFFSLICKKLRSQQGPLHAYCTGYFLFGVVHNQYNNPHFGPMRGGCNWLCNTVDASWVTTLEPSDKTTVNASTG